MKQLLLLLLLACCLRAMAQPTLTRATNAPAAGQTYISTYAKVGGVTIGPAGANVTFNYSNLKDSAQGDTARFINPSATPYAAVFPQANLASQFSTADTTGGIISTSNVYAYYLVNNDGLFSEGIFGHSTTGGVVENDTSVYVPAFRNYPLPLTYTNQFITSSNLITKSATRRDTAVVIDTIQADAWGTLKLPAKTYTNVLRVLTRSVVELTFDIGGFKFTTRSRSLSYSFFTPGYFYPLMSISADTAGNVLDVSYTAGKVLPLQLLAFTATAQKGGVQLKWSSANEVNTHVFQVQRSTTADNFVNIGQVQAKGGAALNNYSFVDDALPAGASVLYYRLAEVDADGATQYSKINPVLVSEAKALRIWPNPLVVSQPLHIQGNSLQRLDVFDVAGHLLKTVSLKGADSYNLNINTLAKGMYLVTVRDGLGKAVTNRIIVQ